MSEYETRIFVKSDEAEQLCPGVGECCSAIFAAVKELIHSGHEPAPVISALLETIVRTMDACNLDNEERQRILISLSAAALTSEDRRSLQ